MTRAFVLVLDSVGIGGAPDAAAYGDSGSNTLGHVAQYCAANPALRGSGRSGQLHLPNLHHLGLGRAMALAGFEAPGFTGGGAGGLYGSAIERSKGKDTPSGHWEIAGCPVEFDWGYFPVTEPCFPPNLIAEFIQQTGVPGILGNKHAAGTTILEELGEEHLRSGKPILYTSVDSVLQIAAHELHFGLARLYEICTVMRRLLMPLNIGRVIARPFLGVKAADFARTANRKDWAILPPRETVLDLAIAAGREVVSIGKIGDIFAHRATGEEVKAAGNQAMFDLTLAVQQRLGAGGFAFANFVDFDTEYGHRRDPAGYAACLEAFDARIPAFIKAMQPGDLAIVTADHGNDPTYKGTDHTREQVPVLAFGPGVRAGSIGVRQSFSDIAASVAQHLGLPAPRHGQAFI